MTMKITINKQDFDDAILVATSSNPEVFNLVKPHFSDTYNRIKRNYLGDIGANFFDKFDGFQPMLKKWSVLRHLSRWSGILILCSLLQVSGL